jgi:hypothetical protein
LATNGSAVGEDEKVSGDEAAGKEADANSQNGVDGHQASGDASGNADSPTENGSQQEELPTPAETRIHRVQLWSIIRSSLHIIEDMMRTRVKKKTASVKDERNKKGVSKDEQITETEKSLYHSDDAKSSKGACEEDSDEEFYDVERSDPSPDTPLVDGLSTSANGIAADAAPLEDSSPWKEELEVLVRGGVPMALRGEVTYIYMRHPFLLMCFYFWSATLVCSFASALASFCGCERKTGREVLSGSTSLQW